MNRTEKKRKGRVIGREGEKAWKVRGREEEVAGDNKEGGMEWDRRGGKENSVQGDGEQTNPMPPTFQQKIDGPHEIQCRSNRRQRKIITASMTNEVCVEEGRRWGGSSKILKVLKNADHHISVDFPQPAGDVNTEISANKVVVQRLWSDTSVGNSQTCQLRNDNVSDSDVSFFLPQNTSEVVHLLIPQQNPCHQTPTRTESEFQDGKPESQALPPFLQSHRDPRS